MYLEEKDYERQMKEEVLPYLNSMKVSGYSKRIQRKPLYYEGFCPDKFKGTVVILHGYSECMEKFKEAAYYFVKSGYQVFLLDQVGHGKSYRFVPEDTSLIHVNHFEEYVIDLHYFIEGTVRKCAEEKPIYLYGHSMGGAVIAYYLELYPKAISKAVLSAPMMGIKCGKYPASLVRMVAGFKVRNGKKFQYAKGHHAYDGVYKFEKSQGLSEPRYAYTYAYRSTNEEYQTNAPSYGWMYQSLRACRRILNPIWTKYIQADVLLLQAGKDKVVKNKAQDKFLDRLPKGRGTRIIYEDSKHEIFMDSTEKIEIYWNQIFDYLESSN